MDNSHKPSLGSVLRRGMARQLELGYRLKVHLVSRFGARLQRNLAMTVVCAIFQVKVLKPLEVVPSSLGSGVREGVDLVRAVGHLEDARPRVCGRERGVLAEPASEPRVSGVCLSRSPSVCPFVCLALPLYALLSVSLSLCMSVCRSRSPSRILFFSLALSLSSSLHLSLSLSLCLSISHTNTQTHAPFQSGRG